MSTFEAAKSLRIPEVLLKGIPEEKEKYIQEKRLEMESRWSNIELDSTGYYIIDQYGKSKYEIKGESK